MIKKEQIAQLTEQCLEGSDRFITKVSIGKDNQINVYIDGDQGVTIDHCVEVSRFIEKNLDREVEDYELKVSSAGVDQPLVLIRQYIKNIGKPVEIIFHDGKKMQGSLTSVDSEKLTIKEIVNIKKNKSKTMVEGESMEIPLQTIKETRVMIIF